MTSFFSKTFSLQTLIFCESFSLVVTVLGYFTDASLFLVSSKTVEYQDLGGVSFMPAELDFGLIC